MLCRNITRGLRSTFSPPLKFPALSGRRRYVTETIQSSIQTLQSFSGMPWWATISLSTLMVRSCLFPMVRYQLVASRKMANAMPEVNFLFQLLRNRLRFIASSDKAERKKVISVFFKGVKACFVLHDISLGEILVYPLINIGVFISFVYSLREMVVHGNAELGLHEGGTLWFTDLTEKDKTFYLPFTAISLSYLALEIAFANSSGKVIMLLKDVTQSLLLLVVPFTTSLPSGVFCYWIPSSVFGITQSIALKSPIIQKLLRLPPPPVKKR